MRVACVMMQRNEEHRLEPWLRYHGYLFGYDNLFVLDHGSEVPAVARLLTRYGRLGVRVTRLPADADYRQKGDYVSAALQELDGTGRYDLLLPLDCDELVVMRGEDGAPCCARNALLAYLRSLTDRPAMLHVTENFLNTLGHPGLFFAIPYQKVLFTRGTCGSVDHGSHQGTSPWTGETRETRLVYVHYHHMRFGRLREMSHEKLRYYVDVEDKAALAAYRGIGWHLVQNLLRTEDEYNEVMVPGGLSIEFPQIIALLKTLGIDPAFCEK